MVVDVLVVVVVVLVVVAEVLVVDDGLVVVVDGLVVVVAGRVTLWLLLLEALGLTVLVDALLPLPLDAELLDEELGRCALLTFLLAAAAPSP